MKYNEMLLNKQFDVTQLGIISSDKVYSSVNGFVFGDWITGRANIIAGSEITNPIYIIESLIRDVICTEHDLVCTEVGNSFAGFNGEIHSLLSNIDGYYVGAYLTNIDRNFTVKVTSYDGENKRCGFDQIQTLYENDRFFITNIKGDDLIDTESFDKVGNWTNGLRKDYRFRLRISEQIKAYDLIQNILEECRCFMFKDPIKYKIVALENDDAVGVLNRPRYENGLKLVDITLSSIDEIYSDFKLYYGFRNQDNTYYSSLSCNKNYSDVGDEYKLKCLEAEKSFKIKKTKTIYLDYVADETTAILILKNIITYSTYQRLIVSYVGNIQHHIKYDQCDIIRFDVKGIIPYICNVWSRFLITNIKIPIANGGQEVQIIAEEIFRDEEYSLVDRDGKLMYDRDGNQLFSRHIQNIGEVLTDRTGKPLRDADGNYIYSRNPLSVTIGSET